MTQPERFSIVARSARRKFSTVDSYRLKNHDLGRIPTPADD